MRRWQRAFLFVIVAGVVWLGGALIWGAYQGYRQRLDSLERTRLAYQQGLADIHYQRALQYLKSGQADLARAELEAALQVQPPHAEAAAALGVSEAHLMKVLQHLSRAGICHATRGPKGGFRLAGDPDQISLLRVFEAIEGPISGTCCLFNERKCRKGGCILGDMVATITDTAKKRMAGTTLAKAAAIMRAERKTRTRIKGG